MSLPSPNLVVPTLANDTMQFQGLLMGAGTVFGFRKLEGTDKPDVRSGNTDRPQSRGQYVGLNQLSKRTITVTFDVGPFGANFGGYGNLMAALAALRTATSTEGVTEYPLWIKLPNAAQVCCMARVVKKNVPYDITADLGGLVQGCALQFEATDPYFYSSPTVSQTVGLPTPGVGFVFPITFPLSFGGGTSPNQLTAVNTGDVPCYPVLVITGPCLNPTVANTSIPGSPTLSFNVQMNAGDQLVIDCDTGSVLFNGAPRQNILMAGSSFFTIAPGVSNIVSFNDQSTSLAAGTLAVWSASAWDGLT